MVRVVGKEGALAYYVVARKGRGSHLGTCGPRDEVPSNAL